MKNRKKGYSKYENPNSDMLNKEPVTKGSVIVANLSDYETIPKNVQDHKRESVVVLKDINDELGIVHIHGKNSVDGKSRKKKKESGLWEEIQKAGQEVYVDIDIRVTDAKGNPIKQGKVFKNTGVMIDKENMSKIESHVYMNKGRSRSVRKIIQSNKEKRDKKKKANK